MPKFNNMYSLIIAATMAFICSHSLNAKDSRAEHYKNKYKAECLNQKITDNFGNGYDALYGTRNMRPVLHGVVYRGGANNFFHKTTKRDNRNPLPDEGLQHLADDGFSASVYLYPNNFDIARKEIKASKGDHKMKYIQNSGGSKPKLRNLLEMTKEVIDNHNYGPIYMHCWNGWHQSGYVSAAILMQFCDYSSDKAVEYWIENTDGANKGYDHVKKKIMEFVPYDDLKISKEIQKDICPCMHADK